VVVAVQETPDESGAAVGEETELLGVVRVLRTQYAGKAKK